MSDSLRLTLNIDPYTLDDAQRRRIVDACAPRSIELRVLPPGVDLDRIDAADTEVLVSEDVPRDLSRWPRLRFVQLLSAGINQLEGHPVWRTNVRLATAAGTHAVPIAQYVTSTLLMLVHNMPALAAFKPTRQWPDRTALACTLVRGKTAGVIGYGGIGRECARQLHALGMGIICLKSDPRRRRQDGFVAFEGTGDPEGALPERWFGPGELNEMLPMCDALIITAPRTPATEGIIGRAELALLPLGARIVIVSRGGIVDESALADALRGGHLGGAAVDAYVKEPPPADHPLFAAPNLILTPHMSGVFEEYWQVLCGLMCLNLQRFVRGEDPLNRASRERGY